jgi:hypothetical protein
MVGLQEKAAKEKGRMKALGSFNRDLTVAR